MTTTVKLAAFVVVSVLTAIFLGMTLAQSRGAPNPVEYSAIFTDASFLTPGSEVRIAGIPVGKVDRVAVRPDATVRVGFHVDPDTPMPTDVRAVIRYKNLIGDRFLELKDGPDPHSPQLAAGATIGLANTAPAVDVDVLVGGFKPLFQALNPEQVNQLSGELISVLQGEGPTVGELLGSVGSLTSTLADRDQVITELIDNLNAVLGTVDAHDAQLSQAVDQLQQLISGLNAERNPIGESITHLNQLSSTASDLLRDIRPPLASSVASLDAVAGTLNQRKPQVTAFLTQYGPIVRDLRSLIARGDFGTGYYCDLRVKLLDAAGQPIYTPWVSSSEHRCTGVPTKAGPR